MTDNYVLYVWHSMMYCMTPYEPPCLVDPVSSSSPLGVDRQEAGSKQDREKFAFCLGPHVPATQKHMINRSPFIDRFLESFFRAFLVYLYWWDQRKDIYIEHRAAWLAEGKLPSRTSFFGDGSCRGCPVCAHQKRFIYRLLTRHDFLPVWLVADK